MPASREPKGVDEVVAEGVFAAAVPNKLGVGVDGAVAPKMLVVGFAADEPNVLLDVPNIFEVEALPAEEADAFPKALIVWSRTSRVCLYDFVQRWITPIKAATLFLNRGFCAYTLEATFIFIIQYCG